MHVLHVQKNDSLYNKSVIIYYVFNVMYSLLFSAVSERHVQQRRVNVDVSGSLLVTGRVSDVLPAVLR